MKKIVKIFIVLIFVMLISGCSLISSDARNVRAPKVLKTPINGSWTVTKVIFIKDNQQYFNYKDKIGVDIIFSNSGFIIDGYYLENPEVKAKVVDTQKFLEKNYQITQNDLGIDSDKLVVVNLYSSNDLVYQVLKVDEDICYIYIDGMFLQLSRLSEDITEEKFNEIKNRENSKLVNLKEKLDANSKDNGILIGVKYNVESEIKYKSFYIKLNGEEIESVKNIDGLKIPTNEGILSLNGQNKVITISNDKKNSIKTSVGEEIENLEILYVSGDYLSVYKNAVNDSEDSLVFKHTEDIQTDSIISLSKLIENGDEIFENTAMEKADPGYISDTNFGIKRHNGKFGLVGLMTYKNGDRPGVWFDLDIDINRIIETNSELSMPFENIKTYIPNARDAVMSSNNRFLVTMENNSLNIYNIVNTELGSNKVYSEEIPAGSEIIQIEKFIGENSVKIQESLNSN